jgi:hypothetical protein
MDAQCIRHRKPGIVGAVTAIGKREVWGSGCPTTEPRPLLAGFPARSGDCPPPRRDGTSALVVRTVGGQGTYLRLTSAG